MNCLNTGIYYALINFAQSSTSKGLFINDVIILGAGVCQIMTVDDIGGRGISQMTTALHKNQSACCKIDVIRG